MSVEDALKQIKSERGLVADLMAMGAEYKKIIDVAGGLERIEQELCKPRVMHKYAENCKPDETGWYWYGWVAPDVVFPAYYDSEEWCYHPDDGIRLQSPKFWYPLEDAPIQPNTNEQ